MFRVHDENEKCLPMVCHGGCFHQPDDSGPQQIPSLISLSERRGRSEANPVGILCIVKAFFFFKLLCWEHKSERKTFCHSFFFKQPIWVNYNLVVICPHRTCVLYFNCLSRPDSSPSVKFDKLIVVCVLRCQVIFFMRQYIVFIKSFIMRIKCSPDFIDSVCCHLLTLWCVL